VAVKFGVIAREDGEPWRTLAAPVPFVYADKDADAWFAASRGEADAVAMRLGARDRCSEYSSWVFGACADHTYAQPIALAVPEGNC
jgi:hypothetical protein